VTQDGLYRIDISELIVPLTFLFVSS